MTANQQPDNPLDTSVMYLKGVGPKRAEVLEKHDIRVIEDIFEFPPRRYLDRSEVSDIVDLREDEVLTVYGEITSKNLVWRGKRRLILKIKDYTGVMQAVWFAQADLFDRIFSTGQMVALSGKPKQYRGWQMVHPDFDIISEEREALHTGQLIPLYPSNQEFKRAGLSNYRLRSILLKGLQKYQARVTETLPNALLSRYRLLRRGTAYRQMHFPDSVDMLDQVWRRFKYEELFYLQLLMALRKFFYYSPVSGIQLSNAKQAIAEGMSLLPFELTGAQQNVLSEVQADIESGKPMSRLVQGDVGSGKTVVALLAMLAAIRSGYQAVLMAPTEILAQQHFLGISALVASSDIKVGLLLGSMKAKEKQTVQNLIALGKYDLVVGTHALIQEAVSFKKLGLAVVDEQHRFGVLQRSELIEKGTTPHVLIMTATPIPRTLALTIYGDLDVSVIDELPPGRKPIQTHWRTQDKLSLIHDFLRQRLNAGDQVYIVYPLVEESEKLDLKAATEGFAELRSAVFPEFELDLLHGRMKMQEKEAVMARFKAGKTQILVSTTVIEVGVDVPNATIMVIEHAERFGLSQLHQLRGRVGRGEKKSHCILVTPTDISDVAQSRMRIMENSNDGFVIAEEDLRLRGGGDFFGTRQHGMPAFRYANLLTDQKIVQTAREDAFALVESDPHLRDPDNIAVREQFKRKFSERFHMANIA